MHKRISHWGNVCTSLFRVNYSNNGNGFFKSLISSESESDEESDNAVENETELESGEHKQGKLHFCDYRL